MPNTADEITATEIDYMWNKGQFGDRDPGSLLNMLWLNNTLRFGIKGCGTKHRQICWGDVRLRLDSISSSSTRNIMSV